MSRAYKNKKFNTDNYIEYGISPKYFGLQAKRFPGSVKKAYCDIDRDEEAEVTFTKRRSPAVRKNYECLTIGDFAPAFGPQDLSQAAPELGPADLESVEFPVPVSGPSNLSVVAPAAGPQNLSSSLLASSSGPQNLTSSIIVPEAGPQSLEVSSNPNSGPQNLSSSLLAPSIGPQNLTSSIIIPEAGPQDLVAELPPDPLYVVVAFYDGNFSPNDGRWYPNDVDDKAIYMGEDRNNALYAFPLVDGARYTIVPETQASYFSSVSRGAGVGNNLWEWYWNKYTPNPGQPYTIVGSAANYVKYDSYSVNPNIGTPKFSLYTSGLNVFLRDLQYNPYNRFPESEVMAIKASLEAGEGTGKPVGSFLTFNPNYKEEFRTHSSTTPPDPY